MVLPAERFRGTLLTCCAVLTIAASLVHAQNPPTIDSVFPPEVNPGDIGVDFSVNGSDFTPNSQLEFICIDPSGIQIQFFEVGNPNQIFAVIDVDPGASPGPCDVRVVTEFGEDVCVGCVNILPGPPPEPTVTGVDPTEVTQGDMGVLLTITGTNFIEPLGVGFSCAGITPGEPTVISDTEIQVLVDVSESAQPGPCDVGVSTEGGMDYCVGCLTILEPPPDPPQITDVSPSEVVQGDDPVSFTITGTNFIEPVEVTFCTGITVSDIVVGDPNTINALASVASDAPPGPCDVSVMAAGGDDTCIGCVTIMEAPLPEPTVTNVDPSELTQGSVGIPVTITGTNFFEPLDVAFACDGVTPGAPVVVNDTQVQVTVDVSKTAQLGPCDVSVTTEGGTGNCFGCVTIVETPPEPPEITDVSPNEIEQGQGPVSITITGTGFFEPLDVSFCDGVTVSDVVVTEPTTINALVSVVPDAPVGPCDVTVSTAGGVATCPGCITITGAPLPEPTITSVDPTELAQGEMAVPLTITGTGFVEPLDVAFSCGGVTPGATQVISDTQIEVLVDVSETAELGPCSIQVTTGGGVGTCPICITVVAPPPPEPVVIGVDPNELTQGDKAVTVTITGSYFIEPLTVDFACDGVTTGTPEVVSDTEIQVAVDVSKTAELGPCNVTVTTDGGAGTCTDCVTIVSAPLPEPTITDVNPGLLIRGESGVDVTVTGTGFIEPLTVDFACDGVTTGTPEVVSETQISVTVDVSETAALGPCDVSVTTEGGTGTCAGCVTVDAGLPTVTAVDPDSLIRGTAAVVTVTGTRFIEPVSIDFGCDGVTVNSAQALSETHIEANVSVAADALLGPCNILVTAAGGQAVCEGCVTVVTAPLPEPVITAVIPDTLRQGETGVEISIVGSDFLEPAVTIECDGVSTVSVEPVDLGEIIATVDVSESAALGPCDVLVSTPGGFAICGGCITIVPEELPIPEITSVDPDSLTRGDQGVTVTIIGSGFIDVMEVALTCGGVSITSTTVVSETEIRITVDASETAALGPCGVQVSTEGGVAICVDCIRVVEPQPVPEPVITDVQPDQVLQGETAFEVTLVGSNFAEPAVVFFSCQGPNAISVGVVEVVSETEILVAIDVDERAPPGLCDVILTIDDQVASCSQCFEIVAVEPPPEEPVEPPAITVFPGEPCGPPGSPVILDDTRPLFDWDYQFSGINEEDIRFRLSLFPQNEGQTVEDALTNVPTMVLDDVDGNSVILPAFIDPLEPGMTYIWVVEAYSLVDPGTIISRSDFCSFGISIEAPVEPGPEVDETGRYISLVSPGNPCENITGTSDYSSMSMESTFRVSVSPEVEQVEIYVWYVPCGYVPVTEIVPRPPDVVIPGPTRPVTGSGRTTGGSETTTGGPVTPGPTIVDESPDQMTIDYALPSYVKGLVCGGAYTWTAVATTADGTEMAADGYYCFRNGDCRETAPSFPPGEPIPPAEGETAPPPEEGTGETISPGETIPPTEAPPPEIPPERPPTEPPPEILCQVCTPTITAEDLDKIRIEPVAPKNLEDFKFPRAVPLLVVGDDTDYIVTKCVNCGTSVQKDVAKDDIAGYVWTLDGKGSLNKPFPDTSADQDSINSILDEIDKLEDRLEAIGKQIENLKTEIESLEPDSAAAHARKDSLGTRADEKAEEANKARSDRDNLLSRIDETLETIASLGLRGEALNDSLSNKASGAELELAAQLEALRAELDSLKEQLLALIRDVQNQTETLIAQITALQDELDDARADLDDLTDQLGSQQGTISTLISTLYAGLRQIGRFRTAYSNFNFTYCGEERHDNNQNLHRLMDSVRPLVRTLNETRREELYDDAVAVLDDLMAAAAACCTPGDARCAAARADLVGKETDLRSLLTDLRDDGPPPRHRTILARLDSLSTVLVQSQQGVDALTATIAALEEQLAQAQSSFTEFVDNANAQQQSIEDQINQKTLEASEKQRELEDAIAARNEAFEAKRPGWEEELSVVTDSLGLMEGEFDAQTDSLQELTLALETASKDSSDAANEADEAENAFDLLKDYLKGLRDNLSKLEDEKEEIEEKIEELNKKLEELLAKLKKIEGNKTVADQTVYYIPPPLDYLIAEKEESQEKYDSLKIELSTKEKEYELAKETFAEWQKAKYLLFEKYARDVYKGKHLQLDLTELKEQKKELEGELNNKKLDEKHDRQNTYEERTAGIDSALVDVGKTIEELEAKIRELEEQLEDLERQIQETEQRIEAKIAERDELKAKIDDRLAELRFQDEQRRRAEDTYERRRGELQEAQERQAAAEQNLRGIRSQISSGVAADDEGVVEGGRTELVEATSQRNLQKDTAGQRLEDLRGTANSIKAMRTASAQSQAAHDSLRKALGDVETALRTLNAQLEDKRRQRIALNKTLRQLKRELEKRKKDKEELEEDKNDALQEADADIDEEVSEVPDIKNLQKQLDELTAAIASTEEQLARLRTNLADYVDKRDKVKSERKEKEKEAEEALEKVRKDLRDFLEAELDAISYTDTLHLEVTDAGLIWPDGPRKHRNAVFVTYKGRDVKVRVRILDGAKGADLQQFDPRCIPAILWKPDGKIKAKGAGGPREEPRNPMLLFRDGEPLWDLWHQAPAGAIYRHETIPLMRIFGDEDIEEVYCESDVCQQAGMSAVWDDVVYTTFGGADFTNTASSEKVLLKVPPIPKDPPACDTLEILQAVGKDSGLLAGDDPLKMKVTYLHKQCTFLEKPDSSLIGSPEDTVTIKVRLGDTAGKGTPGEDIKISITSAQPDNQTGHGIDEIGKLEEFYTTDGAGYIEFDFIYGEKFGAYEVEVDWLRNKDKPKTCEKFTFKLEAPLFHKLAKFGYGPHPLDQNLVDAFNNGETDIDAIAAEPDTSNGNRELAAVTYLRDAEADSVNDIEITFTGTSLGQPVTFDPKDKASEWWGIARSVVEDHPDTVKIKMEAEVKDKKLHPFTRDPKVGAEYTGEKANEFFIGTDKFKVVTEDPFIPGEEISGSGHFEFGPTSPRLQQLVDELGGISLDIQGVVTDDDLNAISGAVKWKGSFGFNVGDRFAFEVTGIGVEAGAGGLLDGAVTFETEKDSTATIVFEAYIGSEGDFIADIKEMPELNFRFAVIQEGASGIIDMSRKAVSLSAPVKEGHSWMGLYIRKLAVNFPTLMGPESPGGDPPGVFAEGFYLGTQGGLNGTIGVTDAFNDMTLVGFTFSLKKMSATFDNGNLKACSMEGDIGLRDPMAGKLSVSLTVTDAPSVAGEIKTENPVAIPSWTLTMSLMEGCSFVYDEKAEVTLNFKAKSDFFEELEVQGLKVNSDYEISLEGFSYSGKPQKFMKAFEYQIKLVSIAREAEDKPYEFKFAGSIQFKDMLSLDAGVTVGEGPAISVDSLRIEYDKGPVALNAGISYSDREFKGEMDLTIEPKIEIEGMLVIGAADKGDGQFYDYWYAELAVGTRILLGQTGLAIFKLGGGVGVNYRPPVGDDPGGPDPQASLGLKALVDVGTLDGKAMMGRLTMVFAEPQFTLNGKIWVMDMEENCYGEGQVVIAWAPTYKISGYVRSVVALPSPDGELVHFQGDIGYCFGDCGANTFYIRSKTLQGKALGFVTAEGTVDINNEYCYLDGKLTYAIEKDVSVAGLGFYVNVGLSYGGQVLICYVDEVSMSAKAQFRGWADVDLKTWFGAIDVLTGNVSTQLMLSYHNRSICASGEIEVSYNILGYSGDYDLSVAVPDECRPYEGCRKG